MSAHTITSPTVDIKEFIAALFPFNHLSEKVLEKLSTKIKVFRYRMGQVIMVQEDMPQQISIIYQGQARLLCFNSRTEKSVTLKLLSAREILGWASHVRGIACETVVASTEVVCFNIDITDFLALIAKETAFAAALHSRAALIEVYELLTAEFNRRADGHTDLIKLAHTCFEQAVVLSSHLKNISPKQLNSELLWLVSSSSQPDFTVGSRLEFNSNRDAKIRVSTNVNLRLLGLPQSLLQTSLVPTSSQTLDVADIPYAPKLIPQPPQPELVQDSQPRKYPFFRGRGQQDAALACFQMLSQYFNIPFRKDMLRRVISTNYEKTGGLSLPFCAAVAELLGLTTQMVRVPATAVVRLQFPVMISWQDSFAIIYQNSNQQLLIAVPEMGLIRRKVKDFAETWGNEGEVLLLQPNKHTPKSRFGLSWFVSVTATLPQGVN
jgi:subfamily B ATP-binding cassette protein HlyB/CyaB